MSIIDTFIGILIWLVQNTVLRLPTEFSGYPIATFDAAWTGVGSWLHTAYSAISVFAPFWLVFSLIATVITAELALVTVRATKWIIATIRGSGT